MDHLEHPSLAFFQSQENLDYINGLHPRLQGLPDHRPHDRPNWQFERLIGEGRFAAVYLVSNNVNGVRRVRTRGLARSYPLNDDSSQ